MPASVNPPEYQTLPSRRKDAQDFSLHSEQETECIHIPSASTVAPQPTLYCSFLFSEDCPLSSPFSSSHLVKMENFGGSFIQGSNNKQMAHSMENGRFYLSRDYLQTAGEPQVQEPRAAITSMTQWPRWRGERWNESHVEQVSLRRKVTLT